MRALDQRRPSAPATRNAAGTATSSDQSRPAGKLRAAELLDDEGGVGAEHHHLAMRHVDDAHHAEGDGEADGGQQQHRAQADAEDDVLGCGHDAEMALDRRRRRVAAATRTLSGAVAGSAARMRQRFAVAALAQRWPRPPADRLRGSRHRPARWRRAPAASACLTPASCSPASACSSAGRAAASRERNTACGRFQPLGPGPGSSGSALPTAASMARRMRLLTLHRLQRARAISVGRRHG